MCMESRYGESQYFVILDIHNKNFPLIPIMSLQKKMLKGNLNGEWCLIVLNSSSVPWNTCYRFSRVIFRFPGRKSAEWGTWPIFINIAIRKSSKKWRRKGKRSTYIQSADRPEIEFNVACDIIEAVKFGKIYGFYDVTSNFELHFRAISWLYLGAAFDLSSSFFELVLMAISTKIGQVPNWITAVSLPR